MTSEITCILNVYKRIEYFEEQLNAVLSQSIPPKRIIIWNNNPDINLSTYEKDNIIVLDSSQNLGVWARFFSQYFLMSGEYICVFDDDTIPGSNWFKNCLNTINKHNALLGTVGVIFKKGCVYNHETRFGWVSGCDDSKMVDIVGHSWFFRKEWISTFIKELPNIDEKYLTCGEDIHLSYVLQKYLNIPTIVPPHPLNDRSLWGAIEDKSWKYGIDKNAISCQPGYHVKFTEAFKNYIDKGFETITNKAECVKVYSNCLEYFINRIKNKNHFAIMRMGDGEYSISINKSIKVQASDDWKYEENSILNKHFNETLDMIQTNVFYGISGPSDNMEMCDYWYKNIHNTHNITYANIFVNKNYSIWENFLKNADYNCVLISQVFPLSRKLGGMKIIDYLPVDKYLVNKWDTEYENYFDLVSKLARSHTNVLFFVAAGPLANIFIHRMYLENPNNTYIDCGSSIDFLTKGIYTRTYQTNNDVYIDKENLPTVYHSISSNNNFKAIEFRLLDTSDINDMHYNDGYAWSRIYEYPLVLSYIKKLSYSEDPFIHNSSWGFEGVHVLFKERLDILSKNCIHSDLRKSSLSNTAIYDITKNPPNDYIEKFDFVVNISTVEEVNYNHWIIIQNLLQQVKKGGYLIITFDLPGLTINLIESKINRKLYIPENLLNGKTSILQNNLYERLNCGLLIIQKNL